MSLRTQESKTTPKRSATKPHQRLHSPTNKTEAQVDLQHPDSHSERGRFAHNFSQVPLYPAQTRPDIPAAVPTANLPASIANTLAKPGFPLPAALRQRAEAFFGADLSHVRVHTNHLAAAANRELAARATTIGSQILLQNQAALQNGRLMAHELTHVLQPVPPRQAPTVSRPSDAAEREARALAHSFPTHTSAQVARSIRPQIPRGAVIHRDDRHPTATVFDAEYLLYALNSTDYDNATQHYYLSPWDRSHLRRVNGLYILAAGQTSLIMPPEVRRAAGGRGVLVDLSLTEIPRLFAADRAGAAQLAIEIAQRELGVTVSNVTLSRGSNQDFTRSTLPSGVGRALRSPLQGVDSSQTAGVEAARRRAASTSQERTLSLSARRGEEPPMQELEWSDRMDVNTLFSRDDAGRADWYVGRLAAFQAQLRESAQSHDLPMQLLAAVILNELADINWADVVQSGPNTFRGSLGIAQIQIDTARRDRLVDLPPGAHRTGWRRAGGHAHDIDAPAMVDMGERLRIGQLLQIPQVAIEAAAREIAQLLTRMGRNRSQPWQVSHNFNAPGPQGNAIYANVGSGTDMNREATLANAVCGAYNSPDVITTSDTSRFPNARIHGQNAYALAQDLYRFRLFRST